jgi:hypothetical protein
VRRLSDADLAAHDEYPNSRIVGNRVAVQHATRMHQQNLYIVQQNMRQQTMNRQLVLLLGQQAATTPATVVEIQELVEISRTAEPQGLDFAQVVSRFVTAPFAGLVQLLPKDRAGAASRSPGCPRPARGRAAAARAGQRAA